MKMPTTKPARRYRTRITRKEIAYLIDTSCDMVRKNEKRWGLDRARVKINARVILYWEDEAMEILRERGLIKP